MKYQKQQNKIREKKIIRKKNVKLNFIFVLVESAEGIFLNHFQVDFVPDQIPDVVDRVLDHCRSGNQDTKIILAYWIIVGLEIKTHKLF